MDSCKLWFIWVSSRPVYVDCFEGKYHLNRTLVIILKRIFHIA